MEMRLAARSCAIALGLLTLTFAGCLGFGGDDDDADRAYRPGEDFVPTGRTVHLKATVLDLAGKEIYPGLKANMWAFCYKPADPDDAYSAAAVEYLPDRGVDVAGSAWKGTCSTPGPTIRVTQGDLVVVDFENEHVHPHTIHWHGQYVPWESDGVPGSTQDSVQPGEAFRYEFVASRAGTLWYHCHVDTQFHVMQGLFGVFIVEPQERLWEPEYDRDVVWTLSTLKRDLVEATPRRAADPHADHKNLGDCGVTGEQGCQNPPVDITADTFMINGVSFPNTLKQEGAHIVLDPNETVRLRILNAGTTIETIHTHGHDMLVTHIDGNPIPPSARYYVDSVPVMPAQRVDVTIEGRPGNEGVWVVHTHVVDHVVNDQQYPGGMLTKIVYPGFEDDMTPFAGVELAGGRPFIEPPVFPEDYERTVKTSLDSSADGSYSFEFPTENPCTIRALVLTVDVDAGSTAAQALNDLVVTVAAPNETTLVSRHMGDGSFAEWIYDAHSTSAILPEGLFNVTISGRAVDTTARFQITVDYAENENELFFDTDRCGGSAPTWSGEAQNGVDEH